MTTIIFNIFITSIVFRRSVRPNGVGKLSVCDGNINARYCWTASTKESSEWFEKGEKLILQHDNAPPHKAVFGSLNNG